MGNLSHVETRWVTFQWAFPPKGHPTYHGPPGFLSFEATGSLEAPLETAAGTAVPAGFLPSCFCETHGTSGHMHMELMLEILFGG